MGDEVHKITAGLVLLICVVIGYVVAASSEIWLIKVLDYDYECNAPILCTILLNAYWPFQSLIYAYVRRTTDGPAREHPPWKAYMFMGASAGAVSLMRSIGINELSGMAYVVCSNTEIVFASLFSVTLLGKPMNAWQVSAVALVLGAVALAVYDPGTGTFGGVESGSSDGFLLGASSTIASRLLSAFNSVLAEWALGQNKKATWVLHELPIAQAVMPTIILPMMLAWVPSANKETQQWNKLFGSRGPTELWGIGGQFLLAITLGSMAITKLVDRLCKMAIIGNRNTIFFEGVDAAMKSIAGLGSFFMFAKYESDTSWTDFVALGIIIVALGMITYGDEVEKAAKKRKEQAPRASVHDGTKYARLGDGEEKGPRDTSSPYLRAINGGDLDDDEADGRFTLDPDSRYRYTITALGRSVQQSFNLSITDLSLHSSGASMDENSLSTVDLYKPPGYKSSSEV